MHLAYLTSSEAKTFAAAAKAKVLQAFQQKYPNADMSTFVAEASFPSKTNAKADVLYIEGPGTWQLVDEGDRKYWPADMEKENFGRGLCWRISLPAGIGQAKRRASNTGRRLFTSCGKCR